MTARTHPTAPTEPPTSARLHGVAALAVVAASALFALVGCASAQTATPHHTAPPTPATPSTHEPDPTASDDPIDEEFTAEELAARELAAGYAAESHEWFNEWREAACTGDRAAENVPECQRLLMDLATGIGAAADLLEAQEAVYLPMRGPGQIARRTADAATVWLDAWCGAYADPACAAPGNALVEEYATFEQVMSIWYDPQHS